MNYQPSCHFDLSPSCLKEIKNDYSLFQMDTCDNRHIQQLRSQIKKIGLHYTEIQTKLSTMTLP